ncbi:MAG TPA: DNA starvation/stationary phase protection protein [Micromonosporaceae bacterium]
MARTTSTHAGSGFAASANLTDGLQRVLVDLIDLHIQDKQAHWNVIGPNFRDLHLQLDEIIESAREASDTIAERMRAVQGTPDGTVDTIAAKSSLPAFPHGEQPTGKVVDLIVERLNAAAKTIRDVEDKIEHEDPPSADLLHMIVADVEKYAWMVGAENRK